MGTADNIAVARAQAERAAKQQQNDDRPDFIVCGAPSDNPDKPTVQELWGRVADPAYSSFTAGEKSRNPGKVYPLLVLDEVQSPVGEAVEGRRALPIVGSVLTRELGPDEANLQPGTTVFLKWEGTRTSKNNGYPYQAYTVSVEPPAAPATGALGQLVEQPEPQRGPEAAGYGNEPPFAPSIA